jgi:hypothetical protein
MGDTKSNEAIVKVKIQRSLAIGHLADDDGDWVFALCKRGVQGLVGRRLMAGEEITVRFICEEIKDGE